MRAIAAQARMHSQRMRVLRMLRWFITKPRPVDSTIFARWARFADAHGAGLLVDAVSSFGAEAIDFKDAGVVGSRGNRQQVLAWRTGRGVRDRTAQRSRTGGQSHLLSGSGRAWRACRISAIRRSRRRCMLTMGWSRRCGSTTNKAAGRLDINTMRRWRSGCEPGLPPWRSIRSFRRISPPWCCAPMTCRRA